MMSTASQWDWLGRAQQLTAAGVPFAIVTIIGEKGSTPRGVGAKLIVEANGNFHGTIGGGQLESLVLKDTREHLVGAVSGTKSYPLCFRTNQCCGGAVEILIETIGLGPQLYLFGAGHVGQSLCQTLEGTPFTTHLIDERDEWINASALPASVWRHQLSWEKFVEQAQWHRGRTYVAVMTHDHQLDLAIVEAVISKPARFIGLIGSDNKWARFQQRLTAAGRDQDQIGRVHCPIGLAVGGKAPREVAISIASQLLKLHYED